MVLFYLINQVAGISIPRAPYGYWMASVKKILLICWRIAADLVSSTVFLNPTIASQ